MNKTRLYLGACLSLFIFSHARGGFEIGNGRKTVENVKGRYSIVVPEKMEVGRSKSFTEILGPLSEGTPRTRLHINVVNEDSLLTLNDLIDSKKDGWTSVKIAGLEGIQKEDVLPTRVHQIEIRLFLRPGQVIVLNLEGAPGPSLMTPFESVKESLGSFKNLN